MKGGIIGSPHINYFGTLWKVILGGVIILFLVLRLVTTRL